MCQNRHKPIIAQNGADIENNLSVLFIQHINKYD